MSDQGETQSQPSIRDRIGAALASTEQPAKPEAQLAPEVETQEPEQLPPEIEAETEPQEAAEATPADWVEVELEGEKLQVPPKWHKAFMQERDYTQKRQADAEYRKALEVREQTLQAQEQTFSQLVPLFVQAESIKAEVSRYQKIDWEALRQNDPLDYSAKRADYAALLQHQNQLSQNIQQGHGYLTQQRQQALAHAAQAAMPVIKRAMPDWGPEKDAQLSRFALDNGATGEELMGLAARPWAVILLEKARKYDELQASKAQLPKKAFTPSPVARPGAKPTHVTADAASYRKNREQFRQSGGKDAGALRALIKAKLGT